MPWFRVSQRHSQTCTTGVRIPGEIRWIKYKLDTHSSGLRQITAFTSVKGDNDVSVPPVGCERTISTRYMLVICKWFLVSADSKLT